MQSQITTSQKGTTLSHGNMDSFTTSLAKKCERLATAEYLVTSFLSDMEPLKARLRTLALDLVRNASVVRYGTVGSESEALETLHANINETLSLLELAFINGLVSEMNFSILKREYVSTRDAVTIKKASRESRSDTILSDAFFEGQKMLSGDHGGDDRALSHPISRPGSFDLGKAAPSSRISIGHSKGQVVLKDTQTPLETTNIRNGGQSPTGQMSDRKATLPKLTPVNLKQKIAPVPTPALESAVQSTGISNVAREARHARILKLIKDKREIAIKDIMEHFPELSEKTIQRDLISFTESGVLKKTGDRRWSRYSIAIV